MSKDIIIGFFKTLSNEMDEEIKAETSENYFRVIYDGIEITVKSLKKSEQIFRSKNVFCEKDLIDSLCRLRLLIIERNNRKRQNSERHPFYKDTNLSVDFFITDQTNEILINY